MSKTLSEYKRRKEIADAEYKLIGQAIDVCFHFIAAAREASSITVTKRSSWNPDAHIDITVTAEQVFAALDAVDAFRHLSKLREEGGPCL